MNKDRKSLKFSFLKSKLQILFHLLLSMILQLTERLKMSKWQYFEKIANFEIFDKSLIQKQFQ